MSTKSSKTLGFLGAVTGARTGEVEGSRTAMGRLVGFECPLEYTSAGRATGPRGVLGPRPSALGPRPSALGPRPRNGVRGVAALYAGREARDPLSRPRAEGCRPRAE